mmetsp:Transcript_60670/g.169549  ORF Transcript_60670/g.169549 Transcript_60670/m.169549 type:complete len:275 (-) Transcript_60670:2066-2890(-)
MAVGCGAAAGTAGVTPGACGHSPTNTVSPRAGFPRLAVASPTAELGWNRGSKSATQERSMGTPAAAPWAGGAHVGGDAEGKACAASGAGAAPTPALLPGHAIPCGAAASPLHREPPARAGGHCGGGGGPGANGAATAATALGAPPQPLPPPPALARGLAPVPLVGDSSPASWPNKAKRLALAKSSAATVAGIGGAGFGACASTRGSVDAADIGWLELGASAWKPRPKVATQGSCDDGGGVCSSKSAAHGAGICGCCGCNCGCNCGCCCGCASAC